MQQAIQEGFILDVLKYYTPYSSYYKIVKATEDDPQFDKKKAEKKLRAYVESQEITIARKAEIMVTHFHEQVAAKAKIGGKARAMVVTSGINRAIDYYIAINRYLEERKSPYKAIIAFSGEKERGEKTVTEASFNEFPSNKIEKEFKKDPYRILVVADKFQTGYDEPLLHTMYVDKVLTDIKAVQTLSRLNRAYPQKNDTFVLDFANDVETIQDAFSQYYKTTILSSETDPTKLYDLIQTMEKHQVYTEAQIDTVVERYLSGAERETIDPILDASVEEYKKLSEDDQVEFKSSVKSFIRIYGFLGSILPYGNLDWEKLYIFLNMLVHKLPSPPEDDLAAGILDAIDLDSYRLEANATVNIALADEDAELDPIPVSIATGKPEPEMDTLTAIIHEFNDLFGNISWQDTDNVRRQIQAIPAMVAKDKKYKNAMRNSDKQNARLESDHALQKVLFSIMSDNMGLFKQFTDNPDFKKWLSDMVFSTTYKKDEGEYSLVEEDAELLMVAEEIDDDYNT
jgi:type I restriction enzyme R subunit